MAKKRVKKPILASKFLLNLLAGVWGKPYFTKKIKLIDDGSLRKIQPPYIVVANHSGFADVGGLMMLSKPNYPNFIASITQIVKWPKLIYNLGVLPKKQFTVDTSLIRDIKYILSKNRSVAIFPEAKLSVVGTPSPIKPAIAKLIKLLKVPLVTVCFHGNYIHHPRWASSKRFCPMTADVQLAVTAEEIKTLSVDEIHKRILQNLSYDDYQYQLDNQIAIEDEHLCEGLNGILYKCPTCGAEFAMTAHGNQLECAKCGATVTQNKFGGLDGGNFAKVTQWYNWQHQCVAEEITHDDFVVEDDFRAEMLVGKNYVDCGMCHIKCDNNALAVTGKNVNVSFKRGTFYTLSFDNEFLYLPTESAVYRFRRLNNFGITTKFNIAIEEQAIADDQSK